MNSVCLKSVSSSLLGMVLLAAPVSAAVATWNSGGADDNWSTADNWGGTAPVALDSVVFGSGARTNPVNDLAAGTEIGGITITNGSPAFTISGNAINLGGNIDDFATTPQTNLLNMALTGARTITVTNGGTLVLRGVISGTDSSYGLIKSGTGALSLVGTNTFGGGLLHNAGTLNLNNASALGTGVLVLAGGAIQNTSGANVTIPNPIVAMTGTTSTLQINSWDLTLAGNISGTGNLTTAYAGAGTHAMILAGTNSDFTGTCTVNNNGSVRFRFASPAAGSSKATWIFNNNTTDGESFNFGNGTIYFGSFTGGGQFRQDTAGTTMVAVGELNRNETFSGTINQAGGGNVCAITKLGTGKWTLTGASTFAGGIILSNGTVNIRAANNVGAGAVTFAGGTLEVTNSFVFANALATTTEGGFIHVVAGSTFTNAGNMTGSGTLTKVGPGTMVISATNTFGGTFIVSASTVRVTGGAVATAVKVATGAVLTVNGTLASPVSIDPSATLNGAGTISGLVAPLAGNSAIDLRNGSGATLTLSGGLSLDSDNVLGFDLGTASDMISAGGTFSQSGVATILVANVSGFGAGFYPVVSGAPGISAANFTLGNTLSGFDLQLIDDSVETLYVQVTATAPTDAYWKGDVDNTWTNLSGANSNWDTDQSGGIDTEALPGAPTAVRFTADNPANLNTVLGANIAIGSLAYLTTNNTTIGGPNTLTIASGLTVDAAAGTNTLDVAQVSLGLSQTWQNDSAAPLIVNASVSGSAALTKAGAGDLQLNSTNTYNGGTVVNGGALVLGHANNTLADAGSVSVAGATLSLGANSDTVGAVDMTNGVIAGSGKLTGTSFALADGSASAALAGVGALTKSGSGTLTLSGANSYAGATTVKEGNLIVDGGGISNVANIVVGDTAGQVATFSVSNGAAVYSGQWQVGTVSGASGNSVSIGGPGSPVVISNAGVIVGSAANANLNSLVVTNATLLSQGEVNVGHGANTATGSTITLQGNVTWDLNTNIFRARQPDAVMTVANGSVVTNISFLWVGNGNNGATLRLENGGRAHLVNNAAFDAEIGRDVGCSSNQIVVTDSGSLLDVGGRTFKVGGGAGSGASRVSNRLVVANSAVVTNIGALFISDNGPGNYNQVLVSSGGEVDVNGQMRVGLNGDAPSFGNGVVVSSGGKLVTGIGAGNPIIGASPNQQDAFVRVTGAGSVWNLSTRGLQIGGSSGTHFTTNSFLEVTDFGVVTNLGDIWLGDQGADFSNRVVVTDGGALYATFGVNIGQSAGSASNYVIVGGAGAPATMRVGTQISIGNGADSSYNQLIVTNGQLYSGGQVKIGNNAGAVGNSAYVGAGGLWDLGGAQLGSYQGGSATLTVTDGGVVTNVGTFVWGDQGSVSNSVMIISNGGKFYLSPVAGTVWSMGYPDGSHDNSVLLTGAGSLWDGGTRTFHIGVPSGALGVGSVSNNTMRIADGATFTNGSLVVQTNLGSRLEMTNAVVDALSLRVGRGALASLAGGVFETPSLVVDAGGTFLTYNDYTQTIARTVTFGLVGNQDHGSVVVQGTAYLAGTLAAVTNDGYVPVVGDVHTVLTATAVSGTFAATNLPALDPTNAWQVTYAADSVVLSVVSVAAPATGYDEYILQIANGQTAYQQDADTDGYANLLEYATGGDPTNADAVAEMDGGRTNGLLQIKFTRNTNSVDATLVVEASTSVVDTAVWTGINTNIAGVWSDPANAVEAGAGTPVNVTVTDTNNAPQRHLRLKVTRP